MSLIRSLHHDAAPIHETGQQLLQTGGLITPGADLPHFGSLAARQFGSRGELPPFVVLPQSIGNTGVGLPHGQSAGSLGSSFEPFVLAADPIGHDYDPRLLFDKARRFVDARPELSVNRPGESLARRTPNAFRLADEPAAVREAYGRTTFGQSCLLARRLVESGVRVVVVNMFETVFGAITWDCHGTRPFSMLEDYKRTLLPELDRAVSALLDDLSASGLIDTTLVVATGEFGRTPRLNPRGGRDHWPGVWSALLTGGGLSGGQIIGRSDESAAAPVDRPVAPTDLLATICQSLGMAAPVPSPV